MKFIHVTVKVLCLTAMVTAINMESVGNKPSEYLQYNLVKFGK